jgi:hypothetical protein
MGTRAVKVAWTVLGLLAAVAVAVVVIGSMCSPCGAAEVVPVVADATDAVAAPVWWLDAVAKAIEGAVALLIGAVFLWIHGKLKGDQAREDAVDALRAGVQEMWVKVARPLKEAAEDGKLNDTEKERLRVAARAAALKVAKGPAKDLLVAWAKPYVDSLISRIVERRKAAV